MKNATINFLIRDDKVFLSEKKERFGKGLLNGYGGKIRKDENPEEGAVREIKEEGGVTVSPADLEKVAIIDFFEDNVPIFKCHVFFAGKWTGEFKESKEMAYPQAYDIDKLPLDRMWDADRVWLPIVFSGKKIHGKAYYEKGMKKMDHFDQEPLE